MSWLSKIRGKLTIKDLAAMLQKSVWIHNIETNVNSMSSQSQTSGMTNGNSSISTSLSDLIDEGARFQDNYKSNSGLLKSAYSMLPCVYTTNSVTQTLQNSSITTTITTRATEVNEPTTVVCNSAPIKTVSNGSALYSVMYAGTGNKITIKRSKIEDDSMTAGRSAGSGSSSTSSSSSSSNNNSNSSSHNAIRITSATTSSTMNSTIASRDLSKELSGIVQFKKPASSRSKTVQKRKGCRCGNATPTPGKLTCCGQRCPCYVESKSCVDCRCRGCRNPHRADGFKVFTFFSVCLKMLLNFCVIFRFDRIYRNWIALK